MLLKVNILYVRIITSNLTELFMIAIIDYGAGNLSSVKKALDYLGAESVITQDAETILGASHVILPGVGSFGDAMESMKKRGLVEVVKEAAEKKNFLGICLGLQLLFESSEESPDTKGLGILEGKIVSIPKDMGLKVPHMGWNSVSIKQKDGIFSGIDDESYFYFVHSYYLTGAEKNAVAGTADYGVNIQCAVQKGRLCATQFHPEKSGAVGLKLLENFIGRED
jgi:glutamine amidotransferase